MPVLTAFPRRRPCRGLNGVFALAAFVLFCPGWTDAPAQTAPAKEYQIKAVFLFNFAQFAEWPAAAFPDASSPLVIGVLGNNPFGAYLDDTVRGEKVNGRPFAVERYRGLEEIKTCHVLFISKSAMPQWDQIQSGLRGRNILTVSDTENFARQGGMIQLATENNKIRLKINVEAARAAGVTISSKLLRPAEIVTSAKN